MLVSVSILLIAQKKAAPPLSFEERNTAMLASSEWMNAKSAIRSLVETIEKNPENIRAKVALGMAYINESRASGNHSYYDDAAMQVLDEVLKSDKSNFEALCGRATVLLSQHHFREALDEGNKIVSLNPHNSFGYGVLTDANIELGNYEAAVKNADKMVSIRPDLRSYSRISYLREIFGDYQGAIEAMLMAVESGLPGLEQTEWARVYLGKLYEQTGELSIAESLYETSLLFRPHYGYGLAGLGRIAKSKMNLSKAVKYFNEAKFSLKDYSFSAELAVIYRMKGEHEKAAAELKECLEELEGIHGHGSHKHHGHYADRELAMVYLEAYNYSKALKHALTEYNRRPGNIDVNATLAWVRYRRGEYAEANKKMDVAMKTKSKNPVLLFRAGLIKAKAGNIAEGKKLIEQSLAINKIISPDLKYQAKKIFGKDELAAALR